MHTTSLMKAVAVGSLLVGAQVFGGNVDRSFTGSRDTCSCKNAGDCTCPKGKCKCKNCGNGHQNKAKVFDTLKGSHETTRLPDTARYEDARGGVFI